MIESNDIIIPELIDIDTLVEFYELVDGVDDVVEINQYPLANKEVIS